MRMGHSDEDCGSVEIDMTTGNDAKDKLINLGG
jgi:hypothetical protein